MSDKLPPKILVIEPDEMLNTNLCNTIERYWFDVTRAHSLDTALRIEKVHPSNLIIISSKIQDHSAIEVGVQLKKAREFPDLPIIFLIEQSESIENYKSINTDYVEFLKRPFTPNDLMTTIRSLLRKSKPIFQDRTISYKDLSMDLSTYKVFRNKAELHLGPTEFKILQLFVSNPKNVYSRGQIIDYVWGVDRDISHRTIDVHINRIRSLIKDDSSEHQFIKTIRSAGYCLD